MTKPNGRLGEAVWAAMRDEYVTGNESYAEIAKRYGVTKSAVEKHGHNRVANMGQTWGEFRVKFLADVEQKTLEHIADDLGSTLARVRLRAAVAAEKALRRIEARLNDGSPIEDKDLVQIAKLALTVKFEVGGDPHGIPIALASKLDNLTVDLLRKLAEGL